MAKRKVFKNGKTSAILIETSLVFSVPVKYRVRSLGAYYALHANKITYNDKRFTHFLKIKKLERVNKFGNAILN